MRPVLASVLSLATALPAQGSGGFNARDLRSRNPATAITAISRAPSDIEPGQFGTALGHRSTAVQLAAVYALNRCDDKAGALAEFEAVLDEHRPWLGAEGPRFGSFDKAVSAALAAAELQRYVKFDEDSPAARVPEATVRVAAVGVFSRLCGEDVDRAEKLLVAAEGGEDVHETAFSDLQLAWGTVAVRSRDAEKLIAAKLGSETVSDRLLGLAAMFAKDEDGNRGDHVEALLAICTAADPVLRYHGLAALLLGPGSDTEARAKRIEAHRAAFERLAQDESLAVRALVAECLGAKGWWEVDVDDTVIQALRSDNAQVVYHGLRSCAYVTDPSTSLISRVAKLLSHEHWMVGVEAAQRLGGFGKAAERSIPRLERAAEKGHPRVRKAVAAALQAIRGW